MTLEQEKRVFSSWPSHRQYKEEKLLVVPVTFVTKLLMNVFILLCSCMILFNTIQNLLK